MRRKNVILTECRPKISRVRGASTDQMVTPESGAETFLNGFTDIPLEAAIPLNI